MADLQWKTIKKKLNDLKAYKKNPRKLSDDKKEHLKASLNKFGLPEYPVVDINGTIVAGHQRVQILKEMGQKEILVSVPNRKLTAEEIEEYNLISNTHAGEWDINLLKNIDIDILKDLDLNELIIDEKLEDIEPVEKELKSMFQIIISCKDESEQEKIYNKLNKEGYQCQISTF